MSIKLNKELTNMVLPVYKGKNEFEDINKKTIEINSDVNVALETLYHDKDIMIFKDFIYNKQCYYINCIFYINNATVFVVADGKYAETIKNLLEEKKYRDAHDFAIKNYEDIIKENKVHFLLENI